MTRGDVHTVREGGAWVLNQYDLLAMSNVIGGDLNVTRADIDHFAEFTGDTFYAHTDPEAAAQQHGCGRFRRCQPARIGVR